jgi:hypothetical protein
MRAKLLISMGKSTFFTVLSRIQDIDTMYVVSREYHYTSEEFAGLEAALRKSLASGNVANWSPHQIWHLTFLKCPKESALTYYQRAMNRYRELFTQIKSQKAAKK